MDRQTWDKIAKAQKEATPQLSNKQCAGLTRIEKAMFTGLEANVDKCEGYRPIKALGNILLRKVSTSFRLKTTEAGGTRSVSWHERTCENPYLDSPEYFAQEDEFQGTDKNGSPFKTDKQKGAFLAGQAGMEKAMLGLVVATGSQALPDFPAEQVIESGMIGGGLYMVATGLYKSMAMLQTEVSEARK
jgi:hypothetical protein